MGRNVHIKSAAYSLIQSRVERLYMAIGKSAAYRAAYLELGERMRRKRNALSFWLPTLLGIALFAAATAWVSRNVGEAAAAADREGLRQVETAVRQAAVSCYSMDGAYPASYEDLKRRGGIAVDEERYTVFYEIFASNIMPEITVVRRKP